MIAVEAIGDSEDRSRLAELLVLLRDVSISEEERKEVVWVLQRIGDPRADRELTRMLVDSTRPDVVREAAGRCLRYSGRAGDDSELRRYWTDGDFILQRHAILSMDRDYADVVEPIASDPLHPFHLESILGMQYGFEEPRFQALKIAALNHVDSRVRVAAASVLVFDEPIAAELPLLRASGDSNETLALEAIQTLGYYPSRACVTHLAALQKSASEPVREMIQGTLMQIAGAFDSVLMDASPSARSKLDAFVMPVMGILELTNDDSYASPESSTPRVSPEKNAIEIAEIFAMLSDPDGQWAARKARLRSTVPRPRNAMERRQLTAFLLGHDDPWVRGEYAAEVFARFDDHASLLQLAEDRSFLARKSAIYSLCLTSPRNEVASFLRSRIEMPETSSTHAQEAERSWTVHAPRAEAAVWLVELARSDERESIRYQAVVELERIGARAEVESLLPLLREPPQVTWSVPIAILDACRALEIAVEPRFLDALVNVDNLHVQAALAKTIV